MTMPRELRLGTRSSLLAVAQSRLVAKQLEAAHPGLRVKLTNMETRGDLDLQTPLTEVDDPDFFSGELDRALLAGDVDLCVHSYKDLGQDRPEAIATAAIPERADPRDVILFRSDIKKRLKDGVPLRIGTCSLRRQHNIGEFLPSALPVRTGIEFHALRGPVDQRVERIMPAAGAEQLDGVVLALAGLSRLWSDSAGRTAIATALSEARWMVLPLAAAPAAHGQGALAVECRTADAAVRELLRTIHCEATERLLRTERELLDETKADDAGIGVTAVPVAEIGFAAWLRGRSATGETLRLVRSGSPGAAAESGAAWNDLAWRESVRTKQTSAELPTNGATFVAHWRALDGYEPGNDTRYWTSGLASWKRLAKQGIWVEGCADNLGFEFICDTLQDPVLGLPPLSDWNALTHKDAIASWADSGVGRVTGTYESRIDLADNTDMAHMQHYRHFYWSSARQYETLRSLLPANAQHACGVGKTLRALRQAGLADVRPFISREEWQQWLG
jgi:hydroxymethylbilane synthase